uniref:Retrovirus-related Pol polyprotein from transposon opus n=1 Tax=Cajanus cajan TaxID=3821 RepID=A0A151SER8_CAJCA|nr:Retrovirus-related Pol polyprotein from transposon opus [Cajanus cajan]
MVKKPNGKWRMCTNYTSLNKACLKDAYPLPNIDQLRLMNKILSDQIGQSMEVYVDDMVVKLRDVSAHEGDLADVFQALRQHRMRLNPEKCVFGVSGGKFLGFMLSNRGIEANPDKCQAILDMKSLSSLKEVQKLTGCFEDEPWTMHVDGSSNAQGSGAGVILASPSGIIVEQSLRFGFRASNHQAEYEALLAGMRLATEMGVKKVICWTDSKIVAEQVRHILRINNEQADQLARLASSRKPGQLRTTIHLEISPSVTAECMMTNIETPTWMTMIQNFIIHGNLPTDPMQARKVRTQTARYSVVDDELYRRGFSTPLLKCVNDQQADYVMREIHEAICGSHSRARTLAAKLLRAGYYWPTLKGDCAEFVKKCVQCQKHGNLIHASATELHIEHPQSNGPAEAANKVILTKLKKRLVLWAYRCTPQSTTKETPFRLAYGADAMIPVEVGEPSFRRQHFNEESNDNSLRAELDVLDEVREKAQIVAEAFKQRMSPRFNSNLKPRTFHEGDLVWRATGSARCNSAEGKLLANWDGPFRVRHALHNGAYKLEELSGKVLPRTWNSTHLKMYCS